MKFISTELFQIVLAQIQNTKFTQNGKSLILNCADHATTQIQFLETSSSQERSGIQNSQIASVQSQICGVHGDE